MNLAIDLPILICGVVIALIIRHVFPDAQFKVLGLIIIAGMMATRLAVTTWLTRRRAR
jgi:hypothetical protein